MRAPPAACAAGGRGHTGSAALWRALHHAPCGALGAALGVVLLLGGCAGQVGLPAALAVAESTTTPAATPFAFTAPTLPEAWVPLPLPGHAPGVTVLALYRPAPAAPARYRVVVVPGSGCTGWAPVAQRYFAGLLHADVLVLHKPNAQPQAGLAAPCSPHFQATDALPFWRDAARAALSAHGWAQVGTPPTTPLASLPLLLVGISEGAELLPDLATVYPQVAGLVMVAAPGLDPVDAGQLQAQRLGQLGAWWQLQAAVASPAPLRADDEVVQGRSLRYWRAFWAWPLAQRLVDGPWPLLRVRGAADEAVAPQAFARFSELAQARTARWCDVALPGADHGLQSAQRDGVQWLWARLEGWARQPNRHVCDSVGTVHGP